MNTIRRNRRLVQKSLSQNQKKAVRKIATTLDNAKAEKRYVLTNVVGEVLNSGSFNHVSATQQGDGDVGFRQGDKIRAYQMSLNYSMDASTSITNAVARLVVFQWYDISTPSMTNLLQDATTVQGKFGQFRTDTSKMYRVLYDKIFPLRTASASDNAIYFRKDTIKKFNKRIDYHGGGTVVGDGQVWTFLVSDKTTGACPYIDMQFQLRYTDM